MSRRSTRVNGSLENGHTDTSTLRSSCGIESIRKAATASTFLGWMRVPGPLLSTR